MLPSVRRVASLSFLALLGCGRTDVLGPREELSLAEPQLSTRAALEDARSRWRALGIASYDLEYREVSAWCCAGRFRVSVRNGTIASVYATHAMGPGEHFPQATVDSLFARLDRAFDQGAEAVYATYDPRLGIPTRVYVDYRVQSADDEIGWSVDEFRRVSR